MRQFNLTGVLSRLQESPMAAVDFANCPKSRGNFDIGVMWFNNTLCKAQGFASRFVVAYKMASLWPADGARLLLNALWYKASSAQRGPIPAGKLKMLHRINISSLSTTWNAGCHSDDSHHVDCRAVLTTPALVEVPARRFMDENTPFMVHITTVSLSHSTNLADAQSNMSAAINEKAWHLWSEHYQHRRTAWKTREILMHKPHHSVLEPLPASFRSKH